MIPNNELRSRGGQNRQFVDFSGYSSPSPNPSLFKDSGNSNLPPPNLNPNLLPPPQSNLFQFQNNHKSDDIQQPPSFRSFVNPPNYPYQQQQQQPHHNPVKSHKSSSSQKSGLIKKLLCCCDAPKFLCLFLWLVFLSILAATAIMVVVYRNPQVAENVIQSETYKNVEQTVKSYLDKHNQQQQQTPPTPEPPVTPPIVKEQQQQQQEQPAPPTPPTPPPQPPVAPPVEQQQQQQQHQEPKQPEVDQQAQTLSNQQQEQKQEIPKEIPQTKPPLKKKKQQQQEYEDEYEQQQQEEYGYGDDEFEDEYSQKKKKKTNTAKTNTQQKAKTKKPKKEFHVDFENEFGTAEELEQMKTSADSKEEPEEEVVMGDYEEDYPTMDGSAVSGDTKKKKKVDSLQQHIHEEEAKAYQKRKKQKPSTASAAAEIQDTVEFRRQNRKFLRKIAKLVSHSAKLNINVNENHQKALLYWLRAFTKMPQTEGQTLIHFSTVPSIELPSMLELDQEGVITEETFNGITATNYIMPLVYMGYISKIVWVRPPWVNEQEVKDGSYMFHIGHVENTNQMGIDINTLKQFEPFYQKLDKLTNTKMASLEIISLDKWIANKQKENSKQLEQLIGIPDTNIHSLPPLLDIDLSFFVSGQVESPYKTPIKGMEKLSEMMIQFLSEIYSLSSIQYTNAKWKRPALVVIGRSINSGLVPIDLWSDAEQYALHTLINVFQDLRQKKNTTTATTATTTTTTATTETKKSETKKQPTNTKQIRKEKAKQEKKKPKTEHKVKTTSKKQTKKPIKEKKPKAEKEPEGDELIKKMRNHAFFKQN